MQKSVPMPFIHGMPAIMDGFYRRHRRTQHRPHHRHQSERPITVDDKWRSKPKINRHHQHNISSISISSSKHHYHHHHHPHHQRNHISMKLIQRHHVIDMERWPHCEQHRPDRHRIQRIVRVPSAIIIVYRHRHHRRVTCPWIQFLRQFMPTTRIGKIPPALIGRLQHLAVQLVRVCYTKSICSF